MLQDLIRAIRRALRAHRRTPGFTAVAVVTFALGLGALAVIYGFVRWTLFISATFEEPQRLAMVVSSQPQRDAYRLSVSYADFLDWREQTGVFEAFEAVSNRRPVVLTDGDQPELLGAEFVSSGYFDLLGLQLHSGRGFFAEEDRTVGTHPVVVLSHEYWQRRFGGDPDILERTVSLNHIPHQVVGVMAPSYRGIMWEKVEIWLPMHMAPLFLKPDYLENRGIHWHMTVARLADDATFDQAHEALNSVATELERLYPSTNRGYRVAVYSMRSLYFDYVAQDLWVSLIGALVLLLLCCVNIAALLLIRGVRRMRETAVRRALGAKRRQLVFDLQMESVTLGVLGGLLGLALAKLFIGPLVAEGTIPPVSFAPNYIDSHVLALGLGASVVCGLVFGLPALVQALAADPNRHLRQSGLKTLSRPFRLGLNAMITVEVALSLVLLFFAGQNFSTFADLRDADPGFPADELMAARVDLQSSSAEELDQVARLYSQMEVAVEALPGVETAALVGPNAPPQVNFYTDITVEDRLGESIDDASLRAYRQYVSPGYFQTLGLDLVEGRVFRDSDTLDSPGVVVLSEALADLLWPDGGALGQRVHRGKPDADFPWLEVVGVVRTARNRGVRNLGQGADLDIYFPLYQDPVRQASLVLHTPEVPTGISAQLREVIGGLDPAVPIYEVSTLREALRNQAADSWFVAVVTGLSATIAALVAAIGLYGILAYGVRQRTAELGVRMALGASARSVMSTVVARGMALVGVGLALGLALIYSVTALADLVPANRDSPDPVLVGLAVSVVALISFLAVYLPARRAVLVEPTVALRHD
ncbi:MAG: ADOP family duplicated permease [Acidobacteriota bacterium]